MTSPSSPTYLVGFGTALDCRPIYFVDPLPPVRLCSLCNVVPPVTYLLECLDSFCKPCYDRILAKGPTCPLHHKDFDVEAVRDIVFTSKMFMATKVRCQRWNSGCEFVGNAQEMVEHLVNSCGFHMVACRRCNASVRRDDMLDHCTGGACEVKETQGDNVSDWALSGGVAQPQGPFESQPGIPEPTTNILSVGTESTSHSPKIVPKSAGEVILEDEGIAIEEGDGSLAKVKYAAEMAIPEDLVSLSAEEEDQFRTDGQHVHQTRADVVFDGDLQESCEEILSRMSAGRPRTTQVAMYVGPSDTQHRDSAYFLIGNKCAYLTASLPGPGKNMKLYLAMRRSTKQNNCCGQEWWYKVIIICSEHRLSSDATNCTCVEATIMNEDNLTRNLGYGGLYAKPLFEIVGCCQVPCSVDDLERRNCVHGGHIHVMVEVLTF